MRAAGAHLRPVRGQPTYFHLLAQTHFGQELPHQKDALSAEAGEVHSDFAGVVPARRLHLVCARFPSQRLSYGLVRYLGRFRQGGLAIAEDTQGELFRQRFADPLARDQWVHLQDGGAGREDFDQGESAAVLLNLKSLLDGLLGLHDVLHVAEGDALNVSGRLQRRQQFGDVQGQAFVAGAASPGRGRAVLPGQRRGGRLAARHAVDGVVDEEHADVLAAVGGVNDLRRADGREVSVTLVGHHDAVRVRALQCRSYCGGAAVCGLNVADIKVVVGEHRANDGAYEYSAVLQAQFGQRLGDELVRYTVSASGAIVGLLLQFRLALKFVKERGRFFVNNFVFSHRTLPT